MATDPGFAFPVRWAAATVGNAEPSLTAPTVVTTVFTAGTNGSKIEQIRVIGLGTTVAGLCNIFAFDGTAYHLFDQFAVTAVSTSPTAVSYVATNVYANFWLPDNTWSLRATQTIAGNNALLKVSVAYGNF